jgi:hypothetical protein
MKCVIWCPKTKKNLPSCPSELFLGGWVCVPAPSCLLAGNLLFRRATRLGFSLSLSLSLVAAAFVQLPLRLLALAGALLLFGN